MEIKILKGLSGCKNASGIAVVIDVFRATTTLCCLLHSKPCAVYIGSSHESVTDIASLTDVECFSELPSVHRTQDNSPLAALTTPLQNRRALLVSRNGTVALNAVQHCDKVLAGAFVNADALVEHVRRLRPTIVSLVAIGHINRGEETVEDNACAELLRARLLGESVDEPTLRRRLQQRIAQRRHDPESPQGPTVEIDLLISCGIGTLDVVPEIRFAESFMEVIDVWAGGLT